MAVNFDHLRLRMKNLIPVVLTGLLFAAVTASGITRIIDLADGYESSSRLEGATARVIRANRIFNGVSYALHAILEHDEGHPTAKCAVKIFDASGTEAEAVLHESAQLVPDKSNDFISFRARGSRS